MIPIWDYGANLKEAYAVIYTMMGCCKAAKVNVYDWLVYFLDHVHDYDYDFSRDLAELLPGALKAKGLVKETGESPMEVGDSPSKLANLALLRQNPYTGFTECLH